MTLAYIKKLGLYIWKTNVKTQKIDGFSLTTHRIIIAKSQISNTLSKDYFF